MSEKSDVKSRFIAEAKDGTLYDADTPLTAEDEKKANKIWSEITSDKK